jgi:hypothetical protein
VRAFIVRPFGTKEDREGRSIDFDRVERELIGPALTWHGIAGRTTGEIAAAGNIREDMFRLLIAADLVIADVSIHNANVFYELGIRHALRPARTLLIRCRADAPVFDLLTDRYLEYDRDQPGAGKSALVGAIEQTLAGGRRDSPIYLLLPRLEAPSREQLLPVPQGFGEEVRRAEADRQPGDLELLAEECRGLAWESVGLREVGRAQFALGAWEGALPTWEALRHLAGEEDLEANTRLATIHQKLGDLVRSDQAIGRALHNAEAGGWDRAELWALQGRNAKERWQADWEDDADLPAAALRSPWIDEAIDAYEAGFTEDRNHFYSGLNALALRTVQAELAATLPHVWGERFDDEAAAGSELEQRAKIRARLAGGVELSLASARARLARAGGDDPWAALSEAELKLLTAARAAPAASRYRQALIAAPAFAVDSARRQLERYRRLGVRHEHVEAALAAFPADAPETAPGPRPRVLAFTGHMIDQPGRSAPRFPAEHEPAARAAIRCAVEAECAMAGGVARGLSGGASGGDLLFQEVCAELKIATDLYLALPQPAFIAASVAPAGPAWVERFRVARARATCRVLAAGEALPGWLQGKPDYDIWQRNNLWVLHNALALGHDQVTLIALWDGRPGDGPGGTEHMVETASARGAKVVVLDTRALFGLP